MNLFKNIKWKEHKDMKTTEFGLGKLVYAIVDGEAKAAKVVCIVQDLAEDGKEILKYRLAIPPVHPKEDVWVDPQDMYVQEAGAKAKLEAIQKEAFRKSVEAKIQQTNDMYELFGFIKADCERIQTELKEKLKKLEDVMSQK